MNNYTEKKINLIINEIYNLTNEKDEIEQKIKMKMKKK